MQTSHFIERADSGLYLIVLIFYRRLFTILSVWRSESWQSLCVIDDLDLEMHSLKILSSLWVVKILVSGDHINAAHFGKGHAKPTPTLPSGSSDPNHFFEKVRQNSVIMRNGVEFLSRAKKRRCQRSLDSGRSAEMHRKLWPLELMLLTWHFTLVCEFAGDILRQPESMPQGCYRGGARSDSGRHSDQRTPAKTVV